MVPTDGMKLTLGDTTLTLYVTPGHTPGTLSTLVPLKDGNQRHLGYILGGRGRRWRITESIFPGYGHSHANLDRID